MPSGRGGDSDSESDLDIEGEGPPSPSLSTEENNNSGDRGRDPESGSEDDPLTKTSPPGGLSGHTSWPAHPAFLSHHSLPHQSPLAAQTLSKITSQFWGFDRPTPPLLPPGPSPHPLDSLSFSFPLPFPGLNPALFKLPPDESRPMFRFKTS